MISSTFATLSRLIAHTCWFQIRERMSSGLESVVAVPWLAESLFPRIKIGAYLCSHTTKWVLGWKNRTSSSTCMHTHSGSALQVFLYHLEVIHCIPHWPEQVQLLGEGEVHLFSWGVIFTMQESLLNVSGKNRKDTWNPWYQIWQGDCG